MEVATTKLGQSFGGTNDTQKSVFDLVDFAGDLTVEDANRSSERNPVLQMRRSSHGFLGLISLIVFEHMDWVLSPTNVFGGGYRQSQEQTHLIPMQVQEQLNQHKVQMEMQVKEMMDAMFSQMQGTIQAQQARIEQLESQQTMGGPLAPAAAHVHSQLQSHAYTSSFNCHHSSEEVQISKEEEEEEEDRTNSMSEGLFFVETSE